jgi:hypothetical protein
MAAGSGRERTRALARTLLGEIALAEGHRPAAKRYWMEAIEIAKRLRDKILQFQAEFPMYRAAVDSGDEVVASSLERRLRRLSAWIPADVEEVKIFRALSSTRNRRTPKSVAQQKRPR